MKYNTINKSFSIFIVASTVLAGPAWSDPANTNRGRLLYENHCLSCHESGVHIRENHKARSLHDVYLQVVRWSADQKLAWRSSETNDVAQYLYRTFYAGNVKDGGGKR